MMKFELDKAQMAQIDAWLKDTVYPAVIAKQKKSRDLRRNANAADCWEMGYPYSGAIGGGLTYEFSNTSIGQVQAARYGDFRIDLTDYSLW